MAVIDHEQVKLRLLYSRKKKLDKTVETLRNETDELKGMLQDVRQFCIKEGIDATNIDSMLGKFAPRRRKDSKFYTLVKLVMSTASMNNNDNDSISSSSMENDLRHIATRDSTLAEAPDSQGTMSSLKHYLSVPFCSPASHSSSDVESVAGDVTIRSPSIFVTSPTSEDSNGAFTFCDVDMEKGDSSSLVIDTPDSVIKEEVSVATMKVASSTLNASLHGGVAFFVGSQTSLDARSSDDDKNGFIFQSNQSTENGWPGYCEGAYGGHDPLHDGFDSNKNMFNQSYGQFLTVPQCMVDMVDISSVSDNHLVTDVENPNLNSSTELRPVNPGFEMRRSASENVSVNSAESFPAHIQYGSPIPARRVPDLHTKRKEYARSRSESEDKEAVSLLRPDTKARFRRHSGEPRSSGRPDLKSELLSARRSQSPTGSSFLAIPGQSGIGNSASYPSSKSMNDVSSAGSGQSNGSGNDGRILRRSCLSLNSDGRKRRTKSAHRVSFKVS